MPFYTRWKVDFLAACEYACLLVHLPRILMLCSHVYLHVPLACFRVFLSSRCDSLLFYLRLLHSLFCLWLLHSFSVHENITHTRAVARV